MRKKLMALTLCVILISSLAGVGTMAWFTAEVKSENNTFQTGTLRLGSEGEDGKYYFGSLTAANLYPGAELEVGITELKNTGTLPLKIYRISADNFNGAHNELNPHLIVALKIGEQEVYRGKLKDLEIEDALEGFANIENPIEVASGESVCMTLFVEMNESAENDVQGLTMTCNFNIFAGQFDMPLTYKNEDDDNGEDPNDYTQEQHIGSGTTGQNDLTIKGVNEENNVTFRMEWAQEQVAYEHMIEMTYVDEEGKIVTVLKVFANQQPVLVEDTETGKGIPANLITIRSIGDHGKQGCIVSIDKQAFPESWSSMDVKFTSKAKKNNGSQEGNTIIISYAGWPIPR